MTILPQPITRRTFVKSLACISLMSTTLYNKGASAAKNQQLMSQIIEYDKRYNEICCLASHNAFANPYNGYPLGFTLDPVDLAIGESATNQRSSITEQLRYGVRGLDLDIWWDEPRKRIVCSHSKTIDVSFSEILTEITTFMQQDENKNEIVTLFFEDNLSGHFKDLSEQLKNTKLWFDISQYDIVVNGWPTLRKMIQNDHRLIAFIQNTCTSTQVEFIQKEILSNQRDIPKPLPFLYDYFVETVYSAASTNINTWVKKRDESASLYGAALLPGINTSNTLAIVNHFKTNPEWTFTDYEGDMNGSPYLKNHIDYFIWNNARIPNFLKLNFVDVGAGREALAYMTSKQDMYDYSWTPFIIDGIDWDTEYLVQILEPYYLVGIDVIDEPGYGITNMMVRATVDYNAQNPEIISAFGRADDDPNRGWVNNEFNGGQRSFLCPNGTYIDAVQVAKHHQWGIVNLRCHLKNYGWSDWITDNEKEDAERLSEFQIVDTIRGFHIKYEGGHGLVDLRYSWLAPEIVNLRSAIDKIIELQNGSHALKKIAFAPNAGWAILVDKMDAWWNGLPPKIGDKIIELYNGGHTLKDIAFAPNGGWAIFYDYNGASVQDIPQSAFNRIVNLQNNGYELKSIAFAPNGGWAIFYDYNGAWMEGMPRGAFDKIVELQNSSHELKTMAIAPNAGWAIFFDSNGAWADGISRSALDKIVELQNGGHELKDIAFASNGGWALLFGDNGAWVNDGLYE